MNKDKFVEEILRRVIVEIEKIESQENSRDSALFGKSAKEKGNCVDIEGKPILVLPSEQCNSCLNSLINRDDLKEKIAVYDKVGNCTDVARYREVIICTLSNMELSKLSAGFCDSPRLELVEKAIMAGINIHIVKEGIGFVSGGKNAPWTFLRGYKQKLDTVRSWGVNIASMREIVESLEGEYGKVDSKGDACVGSNRINKRFVTQRDIEKIYLAGYNEALISSDSKLTDIAKEYAEKNNIAFKIENK